MRTVMVRYKTEAAYADTNATMIHAVFDALRASAPARFRYTSYRLPDGASFVHIATMEGESPLQSLPAFQAFRERLSTQCVEPPVVIELSAVDSYSPAA